MMFKQQPNAFPWGNVLFALGIAIAFGIYAQSVYANARGVTDWLLIVPAAGIGITALLINASIKVIDWYQGRHADSSSQATGGEASLPALLFMGLLTLYVALIPVIGFDLGSVLFVFLGLYLQGERRWRVLIGFSLAVSTLVVIIFIELLRVQLPTLLI